MKPSLIALLCLTFPLHAATSASRHGVVWTFNRDYPTGTYANGDPWVVGPVTITAISPTPTDGQNGAMLNPAIGTTQGFDKDFIPGYNDYISALNVGKNLPLTIQPDNSLVSSITEDAWTTFHTIRNFSILTVVRNAPSAGSFRPPAVGSGSRASLWNESQINYARLASLPRASLSSVPNLADYETWFSFPWLELNPHWTGGYLRPSYMARNGYGRDIAYRTGDAALLLNLDFTQSEKRNLLVGMIQVGIDHYGFISNGGMWYNDGGHNIGRLSPLIIAAGALNDETLKQTIKGSAMHFQEFQSTFVVTQADVGRPLGVWDASLNRMAGTNGDPVVLYTNENIGMGEWGIRHTGAPQMDNNYIPAAYRDINGSTHTATTMTARVMGLRQTIDWEPLFLYAERHLNYEQSPNYKGEWNSGLTPAFHKQFYNAFKSYTPGSPVNGQPPPPPPPAPFKVGDRIAVAKNTNVRITGALTATLLGVQSTNSKGTIRGGPIGPDSDNITWWQMDYDSGTDGWSGQDNFINIPPEPPSPPTGLRVE